MRSRWLLSGSVAVAVSVGLVCWSPVVVAQSGPVCRQGCPCGNACIDCSDTCRVGGGTASGESQDADPNRDVQLIGLYLFGGAIMAIAGAFLTASWWMPCVGSAWAPSQNERKPEVKGKEPCRTDDQCPAYFVCAYPSADSGVGVCEPRRAVPDESKDEKEDDKESGADWFGQTQTTTSEATAVR